MQEVGCLKYKADSCVPVNMAWRVITLRVDEAACIYVEVKVKVKSTLEQATKAQRVSSGVALLFLKPRH